MTSRHVIISVERVCYLFCDVLHRRHTRAVQVAVVLARFDEEVLLDVALHRFA